MDASHGTDTASLSAALAGHGILRLICEDEAMTSGRAEALDHLLATVATAALSGLYAAVGGLGEGSLIATRSGLRRVETLAPGELVVTRDAGLQPIRRIGQVTLGWRELGLLPVLRPLMVPRGAFGPDSPTADLLAAPSLRVLTEARVEARFDALADLIARGEVIFRPDLRRARYHVLSFDRPAAIMANGIWVEGFEGPLATAIVEDAAGALPPHRGGCRLPGGRLGAVTEQL